MTEALIIFVVFPLIVANIVHQSLVIPRCYLSSLNIPVDLGVRLRARPLFGKNKTFRGLLVVAIMTGIVTAFASHMRTFPFPVSPMIFGFIIGGAYMLAELPNSFVKRQLGIPEGVRREGSIGRCFVFFDHIDSVLGAVIALFFLAHPPFVTLFVFSILGVLLHYGIERLLFALGYRKASYY
jgi:CDP-2,3-bis-(O-geranylgeranyl)-sn-glycerol synthase